jgi:NAD/NADP transhydrogenase beta subunit
MPHVRRPIAGALILNTSICVVEALASLSTNTLSLVMERAQNRSRIDYLLATELQNEGRSITTCE